MHLDLPIELFYSVTINLCVIIIEINMDAVTGRVHNPEHGIVGVATFAGFYSINEVRGIRVLQAKYPNEEMLCMTWCI